MDDWFSYLLLPTDMNVLILLPLQKTGDLTGLVICCYYGASL